MWLLLFCFFRHLFVLCVFGCYAFHIAIYVSIWCWAKCCGELINKEKETMTISKRASLKHTNMIKCNYRIQTPETRQREAREQRKEGRRRKKQTNRMFALATKKVENILDVLTETAKNVSCKKDACFLFGWQCCPLK